MKTFYGVKKALWLKSNEAFDLEVIYDLPHKYGELAFEIAKKKRWKLEDAFYLVWNEYYQYGEEDDTLLMEIREKYLFE